MTRSVATHTVYFVGAGPGNADLITRKGWDLLSQADIVLYDALLDIEGFRQAAPSSRWINVGKRVGQLSTSQPFISKSIVNLTLRGYRVVRLKGGDPSIFGRLSEEIEACRAANIDFEIVPGVTAASGCAAELGISLTQRSVSRSVTFLTPKTSARQGGSTHWVPSALASDTVVLYMASTELPLIAQLLVSHGKPAETPVAIVESASLSSRKYVTTLQDCLNLQLEGSGGAVTLVIGDVVSAAGDIAAIHPDRISFMEAV